MCQSSPTSHLFSGLSTGELDWNLSDLRGETRAVVRNALKAADASRTVDEITDDVTRAVFLVSTLPSEMSSKGQAAESSRTSPGPSLEATRGRKLKQKAATPPPAPTRKRFRRPLRILDDEWESESDFGVQESHSDPKKSVGAKVAVPTAPASSPASTSQPLQRSDAPSPASSSDRRDSKPPPLRSQSAPEFRSKASSRGASRASSPIRSGAVVLPAARSTSSPTSSGALGSGGISPTLLVSTLPGVHSSPTFHPPLSLPAISSDESLATLVLSDDDVEIVGVSPAAPPPPSGSRPNAASSSVTGDTDGQHRGPVLRSKAARSEFRSALVLDLWKLMTMTCWV
ncbi:unnamed protein product [Phytophthora fragariaefolia]|uniref:Unnamed protein product n=1 Tax=Phytophthora fragariaefolia TaxID=1490495 RepID=A0A9W6UDI6_9STRA|nr:unnamed protein product [Phytophthora fragariaefolia]